MNEPADQRPSRVETLLFVGIILLPLAVLILWMVPSEGFKNDVGTFWAWSKRLNDLPLSQFYEEGYFCDYPPAYLYILKFVGWVTNLLGAGHESYLGRLCLKAPAILSHFAMVTIFFFWGRRFYPRDQYNAIAMLALTAAVAFWPAQLNNAASFGQVDSVFNLLALSVILCLLQKQVYLAAALYGALVCFKPHALFYLPLIGLFSLRDRWLFDWKKVIISFNVLAVTIFAFIFPFWVGRLDQAFAHYQKTLGSYAYATINAFNFYQLIGYNWRHLNAATILGMDIYLFFAIIVVTLTLFVGYGMFRSYQRDKKFLNWDNTQVLLAGALYVLAIFLFAPKMHERYLMPVFPVLMLIFGRHRHTTLSYLIIGFILAISQDVAIDHFYGAKQDVNGPVVAYGSLLILASFGILLYRFYQSVIIGLDTKTPDPLVALQTLRSTDLPGLLSLAYVSFKNSLRNLPQPTRLNSRDLGLLFVVFMVNIFIHFYQLGATKIPTTRFFLKQETVFKFASSPQIRDVWIYSHTAHGTLNITCVQGTNPMKEIKFGVTNFYAWKKYSFGKPCRYEVNVNQTKLGRNGLAEIQFVTTSGNIVKPVEICEGQDCTRERSHPAIDETRDQPQDYSYVTSTYFDEVYYARAAVELNQGKFPYESTHPPLGKILGAWAIKAFGTAPFQWRTLGSLQGCFIPILLFLIAWYVTYNRGIAFVTATLSTIEFSKIALSRMYTIDVYVTVWLLLGYLFTFVFGMNFLRHIRDGKGFYCTWKNLWPLIPAGIAIGLGLATKWVTVFTTAAILGIVGIILLIEWYRRSGDEGWKKAFPNRFILVAGGSLGIVPALVYFIGYTPYYFMLNSGFSFEKFLSNQNSMWSYHSGLKATHSFSSKFYSWPFVHLPVWLHSGESLFDGMRRTIVMMGNPIVWWGTTPAFVALFYYKELRTRLYLLFIAAAFMAQYFPWIIASRITFQYHYFPSAMFGIILVAIVLFKDNSQPLKVFRYCYLAAAIIVFFIFWPVILGQDVTPNYVNNWLKWFPNWYF